MSANDRTGVGSGSDEWQTPPALFAALHRTFRFDYDAFASHENQLLPAMQPSDRNSIYSTAHGTWGQYAGRKGGESYLTGCFPIHDDDGLEFPWLSRRVFMNPPYSRGFIEKAVAKAAAERILGAEVIVALLPANTDTRWWHDAVVPNASHIEFLRGRVRFVDPATGEPGASPPGGSALVYYFPDWRPGERVVRP